MSRNDSVITIRMPKTLHRALKYAAYDNHTSMNDLVLKILKEQLPKYAPPREQLTFELDQGEGI